MNLKSQLHESSEYLSQGWALQFSVRLALAGTLVMASLTASAPALAQTQQLPPQTNPQQVPPQNNPQNQGPAAPPAKKPDEISRIRAGIGQSAPATSPTNSLPIGILGLKDVSLNKPVMFKVIARDNSIQKAATITYTSYGLPFGANLDPMTGEFSWTPTQAGTYTFYIIATDDQQPPRQGQKYVTINVPPPLPVFGQSAFLKARGLIDARLALLKSGFLNGITNPAPGAPGYPGQNPPGYPNPNGQVQGSGAGTYPPGAQGPPVGSNGNIPNTGVPPGQANNGTQPNGSQVPLNGQASNPNGNNPGANAQPPNTNGSGIPVLTNGYPQSPLNVNQPYNNNQQTPGQSNPQFPNYNNQQGPYYNNQQTPFYPWFNPQLPSYGGQYPQQTPSLNALQQMIGPLEQSYFNVFVPSPERYQLGAGDSLHLKIWAETVPIREFDLQIDDRGGINLPIGGRYVVLRGNTLAQAESLIRKNLADFIRAPQITVTLASLRTMTVLVLGEAYLPGQYQVPAVATLFNMIYMVGGPSDSGSYRDIELRRTGAPTQKIDLYEYLQTGDPRSDVPLQPGDVIFIPPAKINVTVTGEVTKPGVYEAKPGETLAQLLKYVGGAKPSGYVQSVTVATVQPGIGRIVRSVNLADAMVRDTHQLLDGDIVTVLSVRDTVTNQILLEGAVEEPGTYEFRKGLKVSDLISQANGVLPQTYMQQADIFRKNPDQSTTLIRVDLAKALAKDPAANIDLVASDRVVVYDVQDVQWNGDHAVEIRGAVRNPGPRYRPDNMPASDLIIQAGGVLPDAYLAQGYIQRVNKDGTPGPLLKLNLQGLLSGDKSNDVILQDRDVLIVQNVRDAMYIPDGNVRLLGSVVNPGTYVRGTTMHVSDLLELGGGPLPNSGKWVEVSRIRVNKNAPPIRLNLADVQRKNPGADLLLQDGDLVALADDFNVKMTQQTVYISGQVAHAGYYSVNGVKERLSDLLKRAGGLAPNAYLEGGQFSRDPAKTKTPAQLSVSQHVAESLQVVSEDEYKRALAKSKLDAIRAVAMTGSGAASTLAVPGVTTTTPPPPSTGGLAPIVASGPDLVTDSRPLTDSDLTPGGNINVNFAKAMAHPGSFDDVVLTDGDIITIPQVPTSVSVIGAVVQPSLVLYKSGLSLAYYVKRSGGFAGDAAQDQILVIKSNGLITRAKGGVTIRPGDVVWIPTKVMAARLTDKAAEIDAISKNVTTAAVVIAVIKALIK